MSRTTSLLERDLSAKTVRETLSVLSQIMKTAVRARALRENPAAGHSMPTRRQRTRVLTMDQVDRLVAHTDELLPNGTVAARARRASPVGALRVARDGP
jgi:site-specific recombinase XerC